MAELYNGWDYFGQSISDLFGKIGNWLFSRDLGGNSGNNIKEIGSKIFNGLTGETSANAIIQANQMNIDNQNYWNKINMQREDTAHQREVADLQAAGLNPWLSVGGNGSQSTALSTAEAQPVDGSKILQATSAMAMLAITKLLLKK